MNGQDYAASGQLAPRIYEYVLAGLLLAVAAGAVLGYHVYHGFVTGEVARERAYWGIGLPFAGVAAGLYIFAYGWQRGDVAKAIRMSMWLSLGAVGVLAAVLGGLALSRARFGALGIGRAPHGRRRSGWFFGNNYDGDHDDLPMFDGPIFGGVRDEPQDRGPELLTVHCRNCGEMFTPQPPRALCPSCGHSAIGRAG
jgi:hypothetical protein